MECRFLVEAKSFSFSTRKGNTLVCLEEKRKGFSGFILVGSKCSILLVDVVEEAMGAQRKEEFAKTFRDEVRILKIWMVSNKVGWFLEVAVFVEGGRKGVIKLPEGRGGWGWQRFVDELRILVANFVEKSLPMVQADIDGEVGCTANTGVVGCANAEVVGCESCSKSFVVDAQAHMSVLESSLRPLPDGTMEALRCLANDFLAKIRAEVDRVLFFGLGLKVDASSAIKRRMGRVLSRLGLKPKLLFGFKWRGRRRPLAVLSRFKKNADVVRAPNAFSSQGEGEEEASSEEVPVVSVLESEADGSNEAVLPTRLVRCSDAGSLGQGLRCCMRRKWC